MVKIRLVKKIEGKILKNIIGKLRHLSRVSADIQREDYIEMNGLTACLQNFSKIEQTAPVHFDKPMGLKNRLNQETIILEISYNI